MGLFNALVSGTLLPWNWFRRGSRETDYETILSALARDIASVQTRLTQIRTRERRASVTLTIQAFLVWALYTALCWWFALFRAELHNWSLLVVWLPVGGTPVLIFSTRKIVRWWYRRVGAAEEKHLIQLKREQRDKIDEIKRATKYDHLRRLLEKYDDSKPQPTAAAAAAAAAPGQQRPPQQQSKQGPHTPQPSTPQSKAPLTRQEAAQRMAAMRQQAPGGPSGAALPLPPVSVPQTPLQRTWMDKVADAILGADPGLAGPEQKYALICVRCHTHNGLALKDEFDEIQYTCPRCGTFNSRRKSTAPQSSPFTPTRPRHKESEADADDAPPAKPLNGSASEDEERPKQAPETNIDSPPTAQMAVRARKNASSMDMDED